MNVNNDVLSVVRAYHRGWTTKRFDEATRLLSAELKVEVPINTYPTRESFAKAVAAFGSMTTSVDLLAEFAHGDQAMLLYDMDIEGLGRMRVAEHFTIGDGQITRIRQIHDTAALRAAGFGETTGARSLCRPSERVSRPESIRTSLELLVRLH